MLLTITSEAATATDLGYLLHKNPARVHQFDLAFGRATVFYPEATKTRCTAALLLQIDPIDLVRGRECQGPLSFVQAERIHARGKFCPVAPLTVLEIDPQGSKIALIDPWFTQ